MKIDAIWQTMKGCMDRGMATEGILPGGLSVRRRAHRLAERLHGGKAGDERAIAGYLTEHHMTEHR